MTISDRYAEAAANRCDPNHPINAHPDDRAADCPRFIGDEERPFEDRARALDNFIAAYRENRNSGGDVYRIIKHAKALMASIDGFIIDAEELLEEPEEDA